GDSRLATTSSTREIYVWDVSSKNCKLDKKFKSSHVAFGVAFSPDGKLLAAATGGGVIVWNIDQPEQPRLEARLGPMFGVGFDPTGRTLAATGADKRQYQWEVGTWVEKESVARGNTVGQIAFSRDGRFNVVGADSEGNAIVTDLSNGNELTIPS